MAARQISVVGGRSSVTGVVATVFGATGFTGRYIINELGRVGTQVIVPYRGEEVTWRHLKLMGDLGQVVGVPVSLDDEASLDAAISRSNVVINLLGRFWKTKNFSINEANIETASIIAKAAKRVGVERLIHVSSVSAAPGAPSEFSRAKYLSELAVSREFPKATIIRSSTVYGLEDRLINSVSRLAWGYIPLLKEYGLEQPIFVKDFATAIATAALHPENNLDGSTIEIAGPEVVSRADLISYMAKKSQTPLKEVSLTAASWRAYLCDYLRNPAITSDEIAYALQKNIAKNNAIEQFGIKPERFEDAAAPFLEAMYVPPRD